MTIVEKKAGGRRGRVEEHKTRGRYTFLTGPNLIDMEKMMLTYRFTIFVFLCLTLWLVACGTEATPAPTPRLVTATPLPTEIAQATATDEPLPTATATKIPPTPTAVPTATPTKAVISFYPNDPIAATHISLEFAEAVDEASVETAFSLTPNTPGTIRWEGKKLIFEPTAGVLQPQTSYLVEIATTALTSSGEKLFNEPYRWSFDTALQKQSEVVSFGEGLKYQVVTAQSNRQIYFTSTVAQVQAQLLKMDTSQLMDIYQTDEEKLNVAPIYPVVHTWTMETTGAATRYGEGSYTPVYALTLPADVAHGIYLLTIGENLYEVDQLVVIITDQLLAMKQADNQFNFWLSTFQSQAVPQANFTIYGQDKQVLTSGQTDEFGFFETELDVEKEQPLFALAEANGQVALIGFSKFWKDGWRQYDYDPNNYIVNDNKPYLGYLLSDKPVYQPGETIHYQAIIRLNDDAVLTTPPANTPFAVQVGNQVTELFTNEFGVLTGSFVIPAETSAKSYTVKLLLPNQPADSEENPQLIVPVVNHEQNYVVTVNMNKNSFNEGESATATIHVADLAGQPVPNLPLTIQALMQSGYYDGYGSNTVTDTIKLPIGQTDANGNYQVTFPVIYGDSDNYLTEWLLWVVVAGKESTPAAWGGAIYTVLEPDWGASSSWETPPKQSALQVGRDSSVPYQIDQPYPLEVNFTQADGQGIANTPVNLRMVRGSEEITVTLQTDESGRATYQLPREYRHHNLYFSAIDPNGQEIQDYAAAYSFFPSLAISAEQISYTAEGTAQLTIQSEVGGQAWLTIERGTVRRQQLVQLTPPNTVISLPFKADDAPNIFVSVGVWQLATTDVDEYISSSPQDVYWLQDSFELKVKPEKVLNVEVVPDKEEYRPGETATFNIQVADSKGQPVVAGVTLAMLDALCYELNQAPTPDLFNTFYYLRQHLINNFDSVRYRYLNEIMSSPGGATYIVPEQVVIPCQNSVGWLPNIQTDANGQATVQLTLPNQVINWQVAATAVTAETHVGQTAVEITVKP